MAEKKPLVLNDDGSLELLQAGDTITLPDGGVDEYQVLTWVGDKWEWVKTARIVTEETTVYVTTDGNDTTGVGSIAFPYASVDKALEEVGKWVLQAEVIIDVEEGDYPDETSPLVIKHPQGEMLRINGDYRHDSGTLENTSATGGYVDYRFTVTNGNLYSSGDYVLIAMSVNGTNDEYTRGTTTVVTSNATTVTLRHPSFNTGTPVASGAVDVTLATPLVTWHRKVSIYSALGQLQGIEGVYSAIAGDILLHLYPQNAGTINVTYTIFRNTSGTRVGMCIGTGILMSAFAYCGFYNMNCLMGASGGGATARLGYTGCTNCNIGTYSYAGGTTMLSRTHFCGCTSNGMYAVFGSLQMSDGGDNHSLENGSVCSPPRNTVGGYNSMLCY